MPARAVTPWVTWDVFAGVGNGTYQVYDNTGVFKEAISDGLDGFTTGCAFNPSLTRLYTTNFRRTKVVVHDDPNPYPVSQIIDTGLTSPGGSSESVVFDAAGSFYVGHADGDRRLHKYDAAGNLLMTFSPQSERRGTGWNDPAADQRTIFYTSEGGLIKRFDVGGNVQLPDFASIGNRSFALRQPPRMISVPPTSSSCIRYAPASKRIGAAPSPFLIVISSAMSPGQRGKAAPKRKS